MDNDAAGVCGPIYLRVTVGNGKGVSAQDSIILEVPFTSSMQKTWPDALAAVAAATSPPTQLDASTTEENKTPKTQPQLAALEVSRPLTLSSSPSKPIALTEQGAKYRVQCIKHMLPGRIVFQFDCINTMDDVELGDVWVDMVPNITNIFKEAVPTETVKIPKLASKGYGTTFTVFEYPEGKWLTGLFSCTLTSMVRDLDRHTKEPYEHCYEDTYVLATPVEVCLIDYMTAVPLERLDFLEKCSIFDTIPWGQRWNAMANERTTLFDIVKYTYGKEEDTWIKVVRPAGGATCKFAYKRAKEASRKIISALNMEPCQGFNNLPDDGRLITKGKHELRLCGEWLTGIPVLARVRMVGNTNSICLELCVRSPNEDVSVLVSNIIN